MMKTKTILMLAMTLFVSSASICKAVTEYWTVPVPVTEVNSELNDKMPFLSFDGLTLYFSRNTGTYNKHRIHQATRQSLKYKR